MSRYLVDEETMRLMAKAFDEWMRRFAADPKAFQAEFGEVVDDSSYGESCARYLAALMAEAKYPASKTA